METQMIGRANSLHSVDKNPLTEPLPKPGQEESPTPPQADGAVLTEQEKTQNMGDPADKPEQDSKRTASEDQS